MFGTALVALVLSVVPSAPASQPAASRPALTRNPNRQAARPAVVPVVKRVKWQQREALAGSWRFKVAACDVIRKVTLYGRDVWGESVAQLRIADADMKFVLLTVLLQNDGKRASQAPSVWVNPISS